MKVKVNDDYEAYDDEDNLIYRSDNILRFLENIVWKTTIKEGDLVNIFKSYINNYKEMLKLCHEVEL
jgi:hypothetical protein